MSRSGLSLRDRVPFSIPATYCSAAAGSSKQLAAYILVRFLLWTIAWSGIGLARFYVRLLDRGFPRLRRIALRNLELAYPEKTAAERSEITDGVFRSIARIVYSFVLLPKINAKNVHQWISYEGLENYLAAKKLGRGILVATGHLGNWELSAYAHAIMTEPMNVVVRPLDNRQLDEFVEGRRQLTGNKIIGKWDAPRSILRALKANEAVGMLIDQNTSLAEGVFVTFFGVPACATTAFMRMAARTGAPVIPGFAFWCEGTNRYVLRFYPPVPVSGDVQADTQRLHSVIEDIIRQHPDQWLWIHRRWKTRPEGEPDIYKQFDRITEQR
jgi:KDO2-lipid IV(A) lauroyltransferase